MKVTNYQRMVKGIHAFGIDTDYDRKIYRAQLGFDLETEKLNRFGLVDKKFHCTLEGNNKPTEDEAEKDLVMMIEYVKDVFEHAGGV